MSEANEITTSSNVLLLELRGMIEESREQIAQLANATLTMLYWRIGQRMQHEILGDKRADYEKKIVASLGRQFAGEFGRDFGRHSLFNMVRFAEVYLEPKIVQLSWTHFQRIRPLQEDAKEGGA